MTYEALEISWLASALFFAFAQALGAVIIACSPSDLDKAIEYFEWVMKPLNSLLHVSFASLFFAIFFSWYYFVSDGMYLAPSIISLIGIAVYILSNRLINRLVQSRLRPELENTPD